MVCPGAALLRSSLFLGLILIDEFGIGMDLAAVLVAYFFWRKALNLRRDYFQTQSKITR